MSVWQSESWSRPRAGDRWSMDLNFFCSGSDWSISIMFRWRESLSPLCTTDLCCCWCKFSTILNTRVMNHITNYLQSPKFNVASTWCVRTEIGKPLSVHCLKIDCCVDLIGCSTKSSDYGQIFINSLTRVLYSTWPLFEDYRKKVFAAGKIEFHYTIYFKYD